MQIRNNDYGGLCKAMLEGVIRTCSTRYHQCNALGWIGRNYTTACADAHGLCETSDIIGILGDITGLDEKAFSLTYWFYNSSEAHLAIRPETSRSQGMRTSRLEGLLC
jgi:hypothetical protein